MAATPLAPGRIANNVYAFATNQETGITAFAGGGSTDATQLTAQKNVVGTVATAADSVKLPGTRPTPNQPGSAGFMIFVFNQGAASMRVYPGTNAAGATDTINGSASIDVPVGDGLLAIPRTYAAAGTNWDAWVIASGSDSYNPASVAITGGTIAGVVHSATNTYAALAASDAAFDVTGLAAAQGGAITVTGGTSSTSGNAGGAVALVGGTPGATGTGGAVSLTAAAGGATSGAGGAVNVTAGAGTAGNGNGGNVVIAAGAAHGSGIGGMIIKRSLESVAQGAPTAKTTDATLTAAEIKAGIITINQGAGGTSTQTLPLAADMDTAFPSFAAGDSFDVAVMNISTVDAEDATVATNTGWTLVGAMDFPAYNAAGSLNSSGILRLRKTGAGAWSAYRIA